MLRVMVSMMGVLALFAGAGPLLAADAEVADISLADLKKGIEDKQVTLLDCNGTKSYVAGHIPGAIDFDAAKDGLAKMLPKDKAALVVAYCGGPLCGAYKAGVEAVAKLGYTNVKHFSKGISGWKAAGEKADVVALCQKCGQIAGGALCCKADQPKCEKCGMVKDSPGCCPKAVPAAAAEKPEDKKVEKAQPAVDHPAQAKPKDHPAQAKPKDHPAH
ncbi:MAG: hypothetical protein E4H01_16180 [Lysobacterales bacterium]|nr:MAG: hypothetical protein E4H01_16180 [Xanthomonadales bacterium]